MLFWSSLIWDWLLFWRSFDRVWNFICCFFVIMVVWCWMRRIGNKMFMWEWCCIYNLEGIWLWCKCNWFLKIIKLSMWLINFIYWFNVDWIVCRILFLFYIFIYFLKIKCVLKMVFEFFFFFGILNNFLRWILSCCYYD